MVIKLDTRDAVCGINFLSKIHQPFLFFLFRLPNLIKNEKIWYRPHPMSKHSRIYRHFRGMLIKKPIFWNVNRRVVFDRISRLFSLIRSADARTILWKYKYTIRSSHISRDCNNLVRNGRLYWTFVIFGAKVSSAFVIVLIRMAELCGTVEVHSVQRENPNFNYYHETFIVSLWIVQVYLLSYWYISFARFAYDLCFAFNFFWCEFYFVCSTMTNLKNYAYFHGR